MIGEGSFDIKKINEFGFRYLTSIYNNLSLETGINYSKIKEIITPHFTGIRMETKTKTEYLEIISVPLYINYTFWKYIFLNGGPILDFQQSRNSSDSQSGIGYSIGLGGKYNFDNFTLFLNPNFKRHSVLPFNKEKYHQKLTELGVQFGIGYKF